jgi:hypothetical protein
MHRKEKLTVQSQYPNSLEEQLRRRIEKLQHQIRMLRAGAIEAIINQMYEEIREIRAQLEQLKAETPEVDV